MSCEGIIGSVKLTPNSDLIHANQINQYHANKYFQGGNDAKKYFLCYLIYDAFTQVLPNPNNKPTDSAYVLKYSEYSPYKGPSIATGMGSNGEYEYTGYTWDPDIPLSYFTILYNNKKNSGNVLALHTGAETPSNLIGKYIIPTIEFNTDSGKQIYYSLFYSWAPGYYYGLSIIVSRTSESTDDWKIVRCRQTNAPFIRAFDSGSLLPRATFKWGVQPTNGRLIIPTQENGIYCCSDNNTCPKPPVNDDIIANSFYFYGVDINNNIFETPGFAIPMMHNTPPTPDPPTPDPPTPDPPTPDPPTPEPKPVPNNPNCNDSHDEHMARYNKNSRLPLILGLSLGIGIPVLIIIILLCIKKFKKI